MDIDGAGGNVRLSGPNLGEDGVAGDCLAAVVHEQAEEVGFLGGQVHRGIVFEKFAAGEVGGNAAEVEAHDGRELFLVNPPQERGDAGEEFIRGEWFDDVIVGARAQAEDTIRNLAAGGEHENAAVETILARAVTNIDTGGPGKHDIKNQ